jgi:hypothetical protein
MLHKSLMATHLWLIMQQRKTLNRSQVTKVIGNQGLSHDSESTGRQSLPYRVRVVDHIKFKNRHFGLNYKYNISI